MSKYDKASLVHIPSGYRSNRLYNVLPNNSDGDFDFSRGSTATRVDKNGLIETIASSTPRLDYPLLDGVVQDNPTLLLEPQRTNLFPYSEDFTQTDWTKTNLTIESNSTISPDGTLNADKVLEQVDSASGHLMYDNLGLSINTKYNFSIFVKKLNRRYVALQNSYNSANGSIAFFDLDTESLIYTFSTGTIGTFIVSDAKIEKYPNGWYRLSATFESNATLGVLPSLVLANTQWSTGFSYNNLYTGDVTKGIYVWGAQIEQASYSTSYIPTSGATVTRSADAANGAEADFNDSEGVLYANIAALHDDLTFRTISINNGSVDERVVIRYRTSSNKINGLITAGAGNNVLNQAIEVSDETLFSKVAVKYKSGDVAMWINGFERFADSPTFSLSGLNQLDFDRGDSSSDFYGKTKEVITFNEALSDTELEALTSYDSFNEMATEQLYTIE